MLWAGRRDSLAGLKKRQAPPFTFPTWQLLFPSYWLCCLKGIVSIPHHSLICQVGEGEGKIIEGCQRWSSQPSTEGQNSASISRSVSWEEGLQRDLLQDQVAGHMGLPLGKGRWRVGKHTRATGSLTQQSQVHHTVLFYFPNKISC